MSLLPPLKAATTRAPGTCCGEEASFKSLVKAVTCEVSVPIVPSRKSAPDTLTFHKRAKAHSFVSTLLLMCLVIPRPIHFTPVRAPGGIECSMAPGRHMRSLSAKQWGLVLFAACVTASGACRPNPFSRGIAHTEEVYADTVDAAAAIGTIDPGLTSRYGGHDRHGWEQIYRQRREEIVSLLAKLPREGLPRGDARAVA